MADTSLPSPRSSGAPVAVIGGGWAGCAAAVTLAQAGIRVTLYEQARTLGGRARRVERRGLALDNGQHLLVGAYRQTLALLATVHGEARVAALFRRLPLTVAPLAPGVSAAPGAVALRAWRAPHPLHLAGGILSAAGLAWRERFALIADYRRLQRAGFRCAPGTTVAECFAATPQRAMDGLWRPLCLAALNTAPERASAQAFANVLREAFGAPAANSDFLIPAIDLTSLFPEAAARYIADRGATVRLGTGTRGLVADAHGVTIDGERYAAAIVAVGPHQLAGAIGDAGRAPRALQAALAQVAAFDYESITTAYFGYASPPALPAPIVRLDDAPGQWAFDRAGALAERAAAAGAGPEATRGVLAVVISANGPHDALDHPRLAADIDAQLRRLAPALPRAQWSYVIAERRATYACTPALARPAAGRLAAGLYLAGDYTDAEFPPTLEAATRSGVCAARAALADLGIPAS